jgi:F-type H+-transporting ATPase subunit delta
VNQSLVAVRYAKALFKLAKEKAIIDIVNTDLAFIKDAIESSAEFKAFLLSPLFKDSAKKELVKTLTEKYIHPITLKFIYLVIERKREQNLSAIIRNYQDFYRKEKSIRQVIFRSASQLNEGFYEALKSQLKDLLNAEIDLKTEEKKELLGGFVLLVDGKLMDASISNQLKQLQKRLLT